MSSSEAQESGVALARSTDARLTRAGIAANLTGAITVFAFLGLLAFAAASHVSVSSIVAVNVPVFVVYVGITIGIGRSRTRRAYRRHVAWLAAGRDPTGPERVFLLRYPRTVILESSRWWSGAAIVFAAINAPRGVPVAMVVAATILLGMVTSCSLLYLLVERIMRPVVGRGLADGEAPGARTPGVAVRLTASWTVATAVPVSVCVALTVALLANADLGRTTTLAAILLLLVLTLAVGALAMLITAGSVAGPIDTVAAALERIEEGELDTRVPVDDGSEVGMLEAGFNRMAAGLQERERIRDLFGRQVGRDVAQAALEGEVRLGGEQRLVAALFVDIVGSTALAARRPPDEVVALLNTFFAVVVRVTEEQGGWVNKFEGDAALCVFGAPTRTGNPATQALAAARELRPALDREVPEVEAGIGVAAGEAVAGNVGAEQRYEYTVIGDPVNEAARLCDLAKSRPERMLASDAAVEESDPDEAARWTVGEPVTLRGRAEETRPATVRA